MRPAPRSNFASFTRQISSLALSAAFVLTPLAASAGYVTTQEAKMDTVYSQASFGANTVDIRFSAAQTIANAALLFLDNQAEWDQFHTLAPSASPTVNMFFINGLNWCNGPGSPIGCGDQPGNIIVVDSSWAANATFGGNLLSHELGHNLDLAHVMPDDGTNLMNATISTSFALTNAQVTTILASGLIQMDGVQRFIQITPIAVIPEPQTWALMLAGLFGVVVAARRRGGTARP